MATTAPARLADSDPSMDEALRRARAAQSKPSTLTDADEPALTALDRARDAQQAAVHAKYLRDCQLTARR